MKMPFVIRNIRTIAIIFLVIFGICLLFIFFTSPVFASEVKGNLQGFVISADRNRQITEIQIQINRIMAMIVQIQRELNELLKAK